MVKSHQLNVNQLKALRLHPHYRLKVTLNAPLIDWRKIVFWWPPKNGTTGRAQPQQDLNWFSHKLTLVELPSRKLIAISHLDSLIICVINNSASCRRWPVLDGVAYVQLNSCLRGKGCVLPGTARFMAESPTLLPSEKKQNAKTSAKSEFVHDPEFGFNLVWS